MRADAFTTTLLARKIGAGCDVGASRSEISIPARAERSQLEKGSLPGGTQSEETAVCEMFPQWRGHSPHVGEDEQNVAPIGHRAPPFKTKHGGVDESRTPATPQHRTRTRHETCII